MSQVPITRLLEVALLPDDCLSARIPEHAWHQQLEKDSLLVKEKTVSEPPISEERSSIPDPV
eukprot:5335206-Amphidinium_carterae.1